MCHDGPARGWEDAIAEDPLHEEFTTLRTLALALAGIAVAMMVIDNLTGYAARGWPTFLGVVMLMIAYVLWGIHGYNRILLTPGRLRVGREVFTPDDFDRFFGVQPPLLLSPDEQEVVEEEWPVPHDADMRIAGGSWGKRIGTHMLVLKEDATGDLVAIFSRDPVWFQDHLERWLVGHRDDASE